MRMAMLVVVAVLALELGGCAPIEALLGIKTDPETGQKTSDGGGGVAGTVANWFLPGVGTLIGAGAAAYANAKRKEWKAAAISTFEGVEDFAQTPTGKPLADRLKATLTEHHTTAKVYSFVNKVLDRENINKS